MAFQLLSNNSRDAHEFSELRWPTFYQYHYCCDIIENEEVANQEASLSVYHSRKAFSNHPIWYFSAALTILRPQYAAKRRKLAESRAAPGETKIVIPFSMHELFEEGQKTSHLKLCEKSTDEIFSRS